jgi:hypothetical protein
MNPIEIAVDIDLQQDCGKVRPDTPLQQDQHLQTQVHPRVHLRNVDHSHWVFFGRTAFTGSVFGQRQHLEGSADIQDFNLRRVLFCFRKHGRLFQHNRSVAVLQCLADTLALSGTR